MSDSALSTIEKLPPWAIPATAVVIVGALLMRGGGSGGDSGGVNARNYVPTPVDPNLTALAATEVNARLAAFQSVVGVAGEQEIAEITRDRDISIMSYTAGMDERRTNAQLAAALAQDQTARLTTLARTDADFRLGMETTRAAATLGLADIGSRERIAFGGYGVDEQRIAASERVSFGGFGVERERIGAGERLGTAEIGRQTAYDSGVLSNDRYRANTERKGTPGAAERITGKLIDPIVSIIKWIF